MPHEKVTFMQCHKFRFRPIARRIEPKGRELPGIDDWWRMTSLSKKTFRLVNARTNQVVTLGLDQIAGLIPEGLANGSLVLKRQVILKGSRVLVTPLPPLAGSSNMWGQTIADAEEKDRLERLCNHN